MITDEMIRVVHNTVYDEYDRRYILKKCSDLIEDGHVTQSEWLIYCIGYKAILIICLQLSDLLI